MNIIFDLGGVVFHWDAGELITRCFQTDEERLSVQKHFLGHPDWAEMDRGTLPVREALNRASRRSGLPVEAFKKVLDEAHDFLVPKEPTHRLIRQLKKNGHNLYVLSNMHHATAAHLEQNYSIFKLFDGIVFSCRVEMVKPEPEIFNYIIKNYSLIPEESVFIDDMQVNIDAAQKAGMRAILFTDAEECAKKIKQC